MDTPLTYLRQLKGKPEYEDEYKRLRSILCDEDKKELGEPIVSLGTNSELIWNQFSEHTIWAYLIVRTKDGNVYKLVRWDVEQNRLTEECGKVYTWDHNPYHEWAAIS